MLGVDGDKKYVVEFDFPGEDSIRYHNQTRSRINYVVRYAQVIVVSELSKRLRN